MFFRSSNSSDYFWNSNELSQLHIELTNACNAACPMCVRFYNNSPLTRPDLEIGQITLEKFKKYFPPNIIKKCNLILFCGVHGDPCVAKDVYEICEYIDSVSSKTDIKIHTNGGMRKSEWWSKLGKLFAKHRKTLWRKNSQWSVTFSIDGLEDTNHLYRRNVKWKILTENVQSFINAGGYAIWDYLIFRHNEHQIDEARTYSKKIGFEEFVLKKALGVDHGNYLKPMAALSKNGELDYVIEAPVDPSNRNLENPIGEQPLRFRPFNSEDYQYLKSSNFLNEHFQEQVLSVYEDRISKEDNKHYNNCDIKCKSKIRKKNKEIFVDNFGRVMPCCYVGTHLNSVNTDTKTLQLHKHMNDYGWEHFDLNIYTLDEILSNGHLDRVFADSWRRDSVETGRLSYCADTCGTYSGVDRILTHKSNKKGIIFWKK